MTAALHCAAEELEHECPQEFRRLSIRLRVPGLSQSERGVREELRSMREAAKSHRKRTRDRRRASAEATEPPDLG